MTTMFTMVWWVFFGLVSGLIATRAVHGNQRALATHLILGVLGAVAAGVTFHAIGRVPMSEFNLWSLAVANLGAVAVLFGYHRLARRRLTV